MTAIPSTINIESLRAQIALNKRVFKPVNRWYVAAETTNVQLLIMYLHLTRISAFFVLFKHNPPRINRMLKYLLRTPHKLNKLIINYKCSLGCSKKKIPFEYISLARKVIEFVWMRKKIIIHVPLYMEKLPISAPFSDVIIATHVMPGRHT